MEDAMTKLEHEFRLNQFDKLTNENMGKILTQKVYYVLIYYLYQSIFTQSPFPHTVKTLIEKETKLFQNNLNNQQYDYTQESPNIKAHEIFGNDADDFKPGSLEFFSILQQQEDLTMIDIYTFMFWPTYSHYFMAGFAQIDFLNQIFYSGRFNNIQRMLYSRAAFFSPLFIRYIYSSFCPILSPILPQIKYQNFDNQIGEIQEKILANCRSHSNLFPQYILDILVVEATQEQGSNVIFLRNVFINYALHPSYHNISFLQILGFIESHQTPNEQFYEFLHKLFTNKFLRELIKIFSESYNESEIKYIEGKNRENLPSMFQPSILTNYDIISLQNNRKPFEPPNELTFHTISWWTKLHTWVDSDTDLRKSQSAVFKQRIREFLIETDFIPRCNYGTSLDDYMNELVDKGPINKIESRKVEANFIKEQLQQKSENEIKKLLDDIIIDDKEDLMKLSAFTPMIFQLQDLDEQVKPIIQRMFYIAKDFLLRSTIEKYFMNKRKLELKDVINNPNLLKQELTDLMSYVKHENDIVKEKVITEESITDTCYSYLTSSFNYNEFIEFKPELKEEDSMVYEKLSTSENEIMEKLENLLPDKKYLERAKKLLKEKNIFSGMKDAFGINDIYSFGKQLNVAIGMARFQFTKGFSAMDVGPDQLMPFFVTFYSLFHPKDFASRFEFLKMFYIGFFPNETTTFTCYQSALKNGGLDIQI